MTQNLLQGATNTAVGLQGLRQMRNQEQQQLGLQQRQEQERLQQSEAQARINDLKAQYGETGDPAVMRQLILEDPQFSAQISQQFGAIDEAGKTQSLNEAATLKQMLEQNPEEAMAYWQNNLSQNQAFAGLADNFQAGDMEGALNEIGWGVTALGGQQAYDSLFGTGKADTTQFIQELTAAGIKPGSEEFKAAVLEKYGKGKTIGYDVIEGVNPETGKNEYFQISRVNPNEKIALGIEVPMTAQQLKTEAAASAAADKEQSTIENTLTTVQKILTSDGLSGFSGMDSFRRFIPGTKAANVNAWVDQLQSQNFLTAIVQMKGMGALSENEGKKLSSAVAALDPNMTDEAFLKEVQAIETDLLTALDRIQTGKLLTVDDKSKPAVAVTDAEGSGVTINWSDL